MSHLVEGQLDAAQLPDFEILDVPVLDNRPTRVICVGCGLMGMHLAARVKQYGPGIDLQSELIPSSLFALLKCPPVYEKQSDAGGTWLSNLCESRCYRYAPD
jgi:hypothetical protein